MTKNFNILVGTYTRDTKSDGIYQVQNDLIAQCVVKTDNPSYLVAHPNAEVIYCVNEVDDYLPGEELQALNQSIQPSSDETNSGAVSAFFLGEADNGTNPLTLMNQQSSLGADPCHLAMDANGAYVIVSNYSGGTFSSIELDDDGYLNEFVSLTRHSGSGPNQNRQESAHVHSSLIGESCIFVADLGADHVIQYPISDKGEVGTQGQKNIIAAPGSGPRFMATTHSKLLVLNELNNTLVSYQLTDLKERQTIGTVPSNDTLSIAAHLALSDDGQFAYVSNRGLDTLAVFKIEPELALIQIISTGGQHPRHFVLMPNRALHQDTVAGEQSINSELSNDELLLVANQDSNNIIGFTRDSETGLLQQNEIDIHVPAPTCLLPI